MAKVKKLPKYRSADTLADRAKILDGAIKLLSKKGRWCKKYYAVDKKGESVDSGSRKAVAFCAVGALDRAAHNLGYYGGSSVEADFCTFGGFEGGLISFNDDVCQTQDEILSYFTSFRQGIYSEVK